VKFYIINVTGGDWEDGYKGKTVFKTKKISPELVYKKLNKIDDLDWFYIPDQNKLSVFEDGWINRISNDDPYPCVWFNYQEIPEEDYKVLLKYLGGLNNEAIE
jgi:hypothetical protein